MKEKFKLDFKIVGNNIKRFRKLNGWTQHELATHCSVNREKISRIENGTKDYMYSTLLEVCSALSVDVSEVVAKPAKEDMKTPDTFESNEGT
jgi:transcriptional regulator with XRE-family HTH domain